VTRLLQQFWSDALNITSAQLQLLPGMSTGGGSGNSFWIFLEVNCKISRLDLMYKQSRTNSGRSLLLWTHPILRHHLFSDNCLQNTTGHSSSMADTSLGTMKSEGPNGLNDC